jgi:hypothetical protein
MLRLLITHRNREKSENTPNIGPKIAQIAASTNKITDRYRPFSVGSTSCTTITINTIDLG